MMRYRSFGGSGQQLSVLGLGGSGYGRIYGDYDEESAVAALRHAVLERGVNYIDTSPFYGEGSSEQFIGRALRGIPRDRFFIATKVGRYKWNLGERFDFTAARVEASIKESLERLQLDSVDLLQVHDVEFAPSVDVIINETLPAVQRLKERGVCRFIGISGYPLEPLKEIISKSSVKIDSVLSYARLTLHDTSLIGHFSFFRERGVSVLNAAPVAMGLLTLTGPRPWNPALPDIKEACSNAVQYCTEQEVDITKLAVNFSMNFEEVVSTLVAISDRVMLDKNIHSMLSPLTDKEKEVQEEVESRFFKPLKQRHWEGVEPAYYWNEMKRQGLTQPT